MSKYPFLNFWDPKSKYFLSLSHMCNINYDFEKYSSIILATICQDLDTLTHLYVSLSIYF